MNTAAAMQTPMPMMGGMMPQMVPQMMPGMMPQMMPMMGGMMPMPMPMMKMTCEMGADGMMTCRMMPMDGMSMETYAACCERMMTMMRQGMPCMMCCGGMMMICMPMIA